MKVLVGLDDSPYSRSAARVAIDLTARLPGTTLTALHVCNVVAASGSLLRDLPGRLGFEPAVVDAETAAEHATEGRKVLTAFSEVADAAGVAATALLENGAVIDRILAHAEASDLVALGDHGETEVRFPGQGGGHVGDLLDRCTVPMLLTPCDARPLRAAVLGYDGSVGARHALRAVRSLFPAIGAVHLLHVGESGAEILDEAEADLPGGAVTRHVRPGADVRAALLEVARQTGSEVVALGFHGKPSLRSFLYGSAYEALLQADDLSLLVVH